MLFLHRHFDSHGVPYARNASAIYTSIWYAIVQKRVKMLRPAAHSVLKSYCGTSPPLKVIPFREQGKQAEGCGGTGQETAENYPDGQR
jgi:hypothetical protein